MRGYLWENLGQEIYQLFFQAHPLTCLGHENEAAKDYSWKAWHVTHAEGDLSGVKKAPKGRRRGTPSTPSVQEYRTRHRAEGLCISCDRLRHPRSKSYCAQHREADRLRAAAKRALAL